MASIRPRGNKWLVRFNRKGFPEVNKTFDTEEAANQWVAEQEATLSTPKLNSSVLLKDLILRYRDYRSHKKDNKSEWYRLTAIANRNIGEYSLANLTKEVVAGYRDERLKLVSPSSVNRELAGLQGMITHANAEWGFDLPNVFKSVRKPALNPHRERQLTDAELALLLHELRPDGHRSRNKWLLPLVQFALETAMRRGELLELTWDRVFLDARYVQLIKTKNGKPRKVPLSTNAIALLSSLPRTKSVVFPLSPLVVDCAWVRAIKRAGISDFHFHDLRHQAITRMAKRIPNIIELAAISGHSNPNMLKIYYNTSVEELAAKLG